jgi:hypothetical protein
MWKLGEAAQFAEKEYINGIYIAVDVPIPLILSMGPQYTELQVLYTFASFTLDEMCSNELRVQNSNIL